MKSALKIDHWTLEEKYQLLEILMNDLKQEEQKVDSPKWHKKLLDKTEQQLSVGEEKIYSWEDAKEKLRC